MDPIQTEVEGKFEILHKISEGGMGVVYKARHKLLDQISVIKVIRPQHAQDEDLQQRFLNEARTASRLRHPNIAAIQDFFIGDQGNPYLVMEYIEGTTLKQVLEDTGPMDLDLTLEVVRQSLEALSFLHKRGYVHRDVSPDNLMLSKGFEGEPVVKLIDLGIAKNLEAVGNLTSTGMFMGKIRYSSPEQLSGAGDLDQRTDLYSFGVLFYELLTGTSPIRGERMNEIVACHLMGTPMPFEESDPQGRVPEALRRIVLRTLAKNRDQRVASADELLRLLATVRDPGAAPLPAVSSQRPSSSAVPPPALDATVANEIADDTGATELAKVSRRGPRMTTATLVLAVLAVLALGALGWWLLPTLRTIGNGDPSTAQEGPTAQLRQAARDDYRQALLEFGDGRFREAARQLRSATEADPQESRERVEIADGSSEPYLPHFYLGVALYEMNNYVLALDAWKVSENQGVVQGTEVYGRLQELQTASDAIAVEPAILKAAKSLESVQDYSGIVRDLLADSALQSVWQGNPQILASVQDLLGQLEALTAQVEDASRRRDLRALETADTEALDLKAKLVDLANRMLDFDEQERAG